MPLLIKLKKTGIDGAFCNPNPNLQECSGEVIFARDHLEKFPHFLSLSTSALENFPGKRKFSATRAKEIVLNIQSLFQLNRFRQNVDKAQKESEKRTTQFLDRGPGSGSKSIARVYHPPRPAANRPASSSSSSSSSSTPHMVNGQQKARNGNNHPSSSGQ